MAVVYRLTITNWDAYNPRGDVKKPSWYRQDMDFLTDPKFFERTPVVRLVWIAACCTRVKERKEQFDFYAHVVAKQLLFSEEEVCAAIDELAAMGVLTNVSRTHTIGSVRIRSDPAGCDRLVEGTCRDPSATGRDGTVRDMVPSEPPTDQVGGAVSAPPKRKRQPQPVESEDIAIATAWGEYAREASTTVKPDVMAWAQTVRELRKLDGLTHPEMRELLAFVAADRDWRSWTASLPNMRKRMPNGKLKWENARDAMRRAAAPPGPNGAVTEARKAAGAAAVAAVFAEGEPDAHQ